MSQVVSSEQPMTDSVQPEEEKQNPSQLKSASRVLRWILNCIPTILVFALLGGVGLWGHQTGWKIPKFSALMGATSAQPDDWCEDHAVSESQCVECDTDLFPRPKDYGWCKVHGVHQCPLHHPEVAQLKSRPKIQQADLDRASRALALKPRLENSFACTSYQNRIQFQSHKTVLKAGIDIELVERAFIVEQIKVSGEIRYDETKLARLSSKSSGTVWRVEKQVGEHVKKGDILALIDAVGVGQAKTNLLAAIAQERLQKSISQRLQGLAKQGATSARTAQEAETKYQTAHIRVLSAQQTLINLGLPVDANQFHDLSEKELYNHLRFLGLPTELVSQFDPETTTSNLLPIKSPLDGIVVSREVVAGEVVNTTRQLFEVADTRKMWLMLNVPLEDVKYISKGKKVRFKVDGEDEQIEGSISWMSTSADPKTRTVQVRAILTNDLGNLRNESFGTGHIVLREEKEAIVVPNEAIGWEGCCHVVYVRDKDYFKKGSPKLFHIRAVRPGVKNETSTEIIAGVLPGEVIVTKGRDVLQAQLLKSNLGEGCSCCQ